MKPSDNSLQKLLAAARQAPQDVRDEVAPFGFATRVAALAWAQPEAGRSLFSRLALRAAAVSAVLAVAAVAANFTAIRGALDDAAGAGPASDDPVGEVVDLGS